MPNQETDSAITFDYLEADAESKRIASPTPSVVRQTVNGYPVSTSDSEWMVQIKGRDNWTGPFSWLRYLGTDGAVWRAKIHCKGEGQDPNIHIHTWFETEKEGGHANHNADWIGIVDHDG